MAGAVLSTFHTWQVLRTVLEAAPADQLVERQLLLNSMGVATVALTPPQDEAVIRLNPIGLYLRDFDWTAQL